MTLPPTVEAAIAEGWTGLRVSCPVHGERSLPWLTLSRDGRTRVSIAGVVDKLRCHQCGRRPSIVLLESETGTVELKSVQRA